MTNEEVTSYFKGLIECADWVDASYIDGVKVEAIRTAIEAMKERKTGKWVIKRTKESQVIFPHCSCCDWYSYNWVKHPFCPNCGAKMEEEAMNEDSRR